MVSKQQIDCSGKSIPVQFNSKKSKNTNNKLKLFMQQNDFFQEPIRFQTTFVLENQSTLQTQVIQYAVWFQNGYVDLFPFLQHTLLDLKSLYFKVYDFKVHQYINFQTFEHRFYVPTRIVDNDHQVVLIKYNTGFCQTHSVKSIDNSIQHQNKSEIYSKRGQRSKERAILEVIQIVKKWRNLHQNKNGTSMSLPEAAEILGLPKKSLDDYFYQLRLGEKFGFDFHSHMMEGIGFLRSFLKRFKSHRKGDKNQKLPSILKIANQIERYQNLIKCSSQHLISGNCDKMEQEKQQIEICQKSQKISIQKSFYNEFNYDFNKQTDPFVNLGTGSENKNSFSLDFNQGSSFDLFYE